MKSRFLLTATCGVLALMASSLNGQAQEPGSSPADLLTQAEQLRGERRWDQALDLLRQVVVRRAEDEASAALAQLRLGTYRNEMAMPATAETELRKVEADFPEQVALVGASKVHLVDALAFQGRTADAMAAATSLASDPTVRPEHQAWGRVKLAQLLREQGRTEEMLDQLAFLDALPWSPDTTMPKVHGGLVRGELLVQKARWKEAVRVLGDLIEHGLGQDPIGCNWARVRMMQALVNDWSLTRATELAGTVLADHAAGKATDEQAAWALIWKGRALQSRRSYTLAAESLQMAAAVAEPNHPGVVFEGQFALGECYRLHGDHDQALAHYETALNLAMAAGLGEDKQDMARLQAGSEIRHVGEREKGIACLRRGIADPANLSPTDQLLVDRMRSFMRPEEAEAWQDYLRDPHAMTDPTDGMVRAEFGQEASLPASPIVQQPFTRTYWLGQLYHQQGRYGEAISLYTQAETVAQAPDQRAEALKGLALAHQKSAKVYRQANQEAEARSAVAYARQMAEQAAQAWLQAAQAAEGGKAHYAIEQAPLIFRELRLPAEALTAAETVLAQISPQGSPSKTAFAEYMRMRALAWNDRWDEAAQVALQLDRDYGAYGDADLQEIRVAALVRASSYFTWAGDPATGLTLLDDVVARYPGRYTKWIGPYRRLCTQSLGQ